MTSPLAEEKIWFNKHIYEEAERRYYESKAQLLMKNGIIPRPSHFQIAPRNQLALIQMPKETQKKDNKHPNLEGDHLPLSPPLTPNAEKPQPPKGKDIKEMKNEADKEGMKKKRRKDRSKKKSTEDVVHVENSNVSL
ncbi:hypothetical protein J437_LFUL011938 [Ladona fulva]|uniref:Uncharacterized protein n=1 Tax=Ladona fulva TaxID=123851 RepID=A0A8K0NVU0_LADFU|nr:hypothetical protein J437_LFUL011938 [Ladona fulva]